MPLVRNTYGKARVRVMRVAREGERNAVRELTVQTLLDGDFAAAYTAGDNSRVIATDTIKNITMLVAREELSTAAEMYAQALAARFLSRYQQVEKVVVTTHETKWRRAEFGDRPHEHSFVLDGNGQPYACVEATRAGASVTSGITGYTFMKSTGSGWVGYVMDDLTTLPETTDRISATAMNARWTWLKPPADYDASNARVLATMLEVFGTTYSYGVQDSLFRMGEAALAAVPGLLEVSMACPTDEPHGQIECTVGR